MACSPKQLSAIVAALGTLSFLLGILAEHKKPLGGESVEGKGGGVICKYPSDPSVALGYLSAVFLAASSAFGYFSLFYPYNGKSVPQSAFFSSGKFTAFFNIAMGTAGFAAALLLYTTISEHLLLMRNVSHRPDSIQMVTDRCPTAKPGLLGGAAFASLDSSMFWLIALMLGTNVREDYFDEARNQNQGNTSEAHVTIG